MLKRILSLSVMIFFHIRVLYPADAIGYMRFMTPEKAKEKHVMAKSYTIPQDFLDSQFQDIIAASDGGLISP